MKYIKYRQGKDVNPERIVTMKKFNKETKFILTLIIIAIIGLVFRAYGLWLTNKVEQQVIESAVLIESNEDGYTLSFDGEEYWYTFD